MRQKTFCSFRRTACFPTAWLLGLASDVHHMNTTIWPALPDTGFIVFRHCAKTHDGRPISAAKKASLPSIRSSPSRRFGTQSRKNVFRWLAKTNSRVRPTTYSTLELRALLLLHSQAGQHDQVHQHCSRQRLQLVLVYTPGTPGDRNATAERRCGKGSAVCLRPLVASPRNTLSEYIQQGEFLILLSRNNRISKQTNWWVWRS